MDPQHYALFIDNEVKGPFSRAQVEEMIAQGQVQADTPCATGGSSEWMPTSTLFTFGVKKPTTLRDTLLQEKERDTSRLDPVVRSRILQLGFADAATVDMLTPAQALAALAAHDKKNQQEKKNKKLAIFAGLPASLLVGGIFILTPPGEAVTEWIAGRFIKPAPEFLSARLTLNRELSAVAAAREELASTELLPPPGREGKQFFSDRVAPPNSLGREYLFPFEIDPAIAEHAQGEPRFVYLRSIPTRIKEDMVKQENVVLKYLHPDQLTDKLDPQELAASWELFKKQEANQKLAEFVEKNTSAIAQKTEDGQWYVEGSRPGNLVAILEIKGFPVYFPGGDEQKHVTFGKMERRVLSPEAIVAQEKYVVNDKKIDGNTPCGIRVSFQNKTYFIKKLSPTWHYLAVIRPEMDSSPMWIRVSEEEYNKAKVDDIYPTTKLFDYTAYSRPMPSRISGNIEMLDL